MIEFQHEPGASAPSKAAIRYSRGDEAYAYIRYKYDPAFYGGKMPVEFTRFHGGAPTEEVGKMFTVRLLELKLAEKPLPPDALDPRKAVAYKTTFFYSNDVNYWVGKSGKLRAVLSAEEARKNARYTHSPVLARYVVGSLLILVTISVLAFLFRPNITTNSK